jgi:hypothetical protein
MKRTDSTGRWVRHAAWIVLACAAPLAGAEDATSVAAKAQAAYFAGSAPQLAALATATAPWARSSDRQQLYSHAYVQFRALQLALAAKQNDAAEKAGDACVAALDAATKLDPKFTEAYALQSACYGYMANLGGFGAIRNGGRSGKSIEAALALDARNPRVILVEGFGVYFRPKFVGGDKLKGCERFAAAAAAFDALPAEARAGGYGWGAPEAHYWSGRCAIDAGKAAAARASFERALVLAPDFLAARKRLGP